MIYASLALTTLASFGAAFSAFYGWKSARYSLIAVESTIVLRLLEQYSDSEMLSDLRCLRGFRDSGGLSKLDQWVEDLSDTDADAVRIDLARRRVKSYFLNPMRMNKLGLLRTDTLQIVLNQQGIDLLFDTIEPLDRALSPDNDYSAFSDLRAIIPSSGRPQPLA